MSYEWCIKIINTGKYRNEEMKRIKRFDTGTWGIMNEPQ